MRMGWRKGRLAVVVAAAALATGCAVPRTAWKVVRALSPVRLVRSRPGRVPVDEYDAAKKLFLRGDYRQAAAGFDVWLTRYAGNALEPAAMYYLANSQAQARRPARAKASYERLVKTYPESDWAAFARQDLVVLATAGGRVPLTRRRLRWWHPADWFTPDPPAVRSFKQGRMAFDRRRYEQALSTFRTLAERHPESPLAPASWYYVTRCYERLGDLGKARQTLQHLMAAHKGSHWEKLAGDDYERLRED